MNTKFKEILIAGAALTALIVSSSASFAEGDTGADDETVDTAGPAVTAPAVPGPTDAAPSTKPVSPAPTASGSPAAPQTRAAAKNIDAEIPEAPDTLPGSLPGGVFRLNNVYVERSALGNALGVGQAADGVTTLGFLSGAELLPIAGGIIGFVQNRPCDNARLLLEKMGQYQGVQIVTGKCKDARQPLKSVWNFLAPKSRFRFTTELRVTSMPADRVIRLNDVPLRSMRACGETFELFSQLNVTPQMAASQDASKVNAKSVKLLGSCNLSNNGQVVMRSRLMFQ